MTEQEKKLRIKLLQLMENTAKLRRLQRLEKRNSTTQTRTEAAAAEKYIDQLIRENTDFLFPIKNKSFQYDA